MVKTISKVLLLTILSGFLLACKDKCVQTSTYMSVQSTQIDIANIRNSIKSATARDLEKPGKIYIKGNFLFINELKKGIHIIDNTNAKAPLNIAFIEILGNVDMAVQDNILYADSYTDMVAIDINDPRNIKELGRVSDVFKSGTIDGITWYYNVDLKKIVDGEWKKTTVSQEISCDLQPIYYPYWSYYPYALDKSFSTSFTQNGSSVTGKGGSMARFTISNNLLYAVSSEDMKLFGLKNPAQPTMETTVKLGFGIETIFPYKDNLFIGTTTGLQIWSNKDPYNPKFLSRLEHARACDPVVVQNDMAYVTLRSVNVFGACGPAINNQLDVIDVTVPTSPVLKKTFAMENPYGLGIDNASLFICEGNKGLKSFDASNPLDIKLQQHFKDINAFDVIPLNNILMVIGKEGLYQYDYTDKTNLKLLSVIKVKSAQ